jgi:hypothetical protein
MKEVNSGAQASGLGSAKSRCRVRLDWSRLLGFDQVSACREDDPTRHRVRLARLGSRIGTKPGQKNVVA